MVQHSMFHMPVGKQVQTNQHKTEYNISDRSLLSSSFSEYSMSLYDLDRLSGIANWNRLIGPSALQSAGLQHGTTPG